MIGLCAGAHKRIVRGMPDKPLWYGRLEEAIAELEALPFPWVDRSTVERVLGVGRRRAQQILSPCGRRKVGASVLADRAELIERLRALARGDAAGYERQRRRRLALELERLAAGWRERPRLLVSAPPRLAYQGLDRLPAGVAIGPGEVRVRFGSLTEALEKLLALTMAIGNDPGGFEAAAGL